MVASRPSRAFTLIELLVVIAIIGLLASIVMASLSSARTKAALAGGQQFASSIDNSLGAQTIGWWDFSECSGGSVADQSGFGGTGTLSGAGLPTWSSDTPLNRGCSLSFNGSSAYVDISGSSAASSILNVTGSAITMAAWIKLTPGVSASQQIMMKAVNGGTARQYGIYVSGSNAFGCNINAGSLFDNVTGSLSAGQWHYLVCAYNGSNVSYYIDGQLVWSPTLSGNIVSQPADFLIGAFVPGVSLFNGNIDGVRVFASGLSADAVRRLYAAGLPAHAVASAAPIAP